MSKKYETQTVKIVIWSPGQKATTKLSTRRVAVWSLNNRKENNYEN
jgi:hypothetical protein